MKLARMDCSAIRRPPRLLCRLFTFGAPNNNEVVGLTRRRHYGVSVAIQGILLPNVYY